LRIRDSASQEARIDVTLSGSGPSLEMALRESEERLRLAIEVGRMAVWEVDHATGSVAGSPELNRLFGLGAHARPTLNEIRQLYAPGEFERLRREGWTYETIVQSAPAATLAADWTHVTVEFAIVTPGRVRKELLLRARHVAALHGTGLRTTGVLVDITERKRAEERLQLVASEMRHRVKNTLSIVQAIASQTIARAARDQEAVANFMQRLRALSTAMNVILTDDAGPVSLTRLLEDVLRPYRAEKSDSITLLGPEAALPARHVTALGLVLHELCTNAVKYGALSCDVGRVSVTWRQAGSVLDLDWLERGGPAVEPPQRQGFGSRLLASALGPDAVRLTFEPEGLGARIQLDVSS
jgi:two-component sensor histidine kinase